MPSKLGIHAISPGETIPTVRALAEQGTPMGTVKAVDGVAMLREVKAISPQTITFGRFTRGQHGEEVERPRLEGDLSAVARRLMDALLPRWEAHRAYVDYWEVVNEIDPPGADGHRRLAELMGHCMTIAEAEGYKLGLFSYSLGVPEYDEFAAVAETGVFAQAKAGGHVLALHEYAWPMDKWYGEPLPGLPTYPDRGPLACRYRWWYEDFLIPRDEVIPLYITETNLDTDIRALPTETWMAQMAWYDAELRKDFYVLGAHIFTLGDVSGHWAGFDFTRMLPALKAHIAELYDVADPVWPSGGDKPPKPVAEKPPHLILLPPRSPRALIEATAAYAASHKAALVWHPSWLLRLREGERATVINPAAWGEDYQEAAAATAATITTVEAENAEQLLAALPRTKRKPRNSAASNGYHII